MRLIHINTGLCENHIVGNKQEIMIKSFKLSCCMYEQEHESFKS